MLTLKTRDRVVRNGLFKEMTLRLTSGAYRLNSQEKNATDREMAHAQAPKEEKTCSDTGGNRKLGASCGGTAWQDSAERRVGLGCAGSSRPWWNLVFILSASEEQRWDDTRSKNLLGDLRKVLCEMGVRVKIKLLKRLQKKLCCLPPPLVIKNKNNTKYIIETLFVF